MNKAFANAERMRIELIGIDDIVGEDIGKEA